MAETLAFEMLGILVLLEHICLAFNFALEMLLTS